jgi:site-specific recombinase XerD
MQKGKQTRNVPLTERLGHADVSTTMISTHMSGRGEQETSSFTLHRSQVEAF